MDERDRAYRALFTALAFVAFACAFVTTPIVARSANGFAATIPPPARPLPAPGALAVVLPRRDPFTGDDARTNTTVTQPPASAYSQAGPSSAQDTMRGMPAMPAMPPFEISVPNALPPNAGAATASVPATGVTTAGLPTGDGASARSFSNQVSAVRVTAVVTGAQPWAIVEDTGVTRLVTLGDRVAGDAVASITAAGIRLVHGTVLPVVPARSAIQSQPAIQSTPAVRAVSPTPYLPATRFAPPTTFAPAVRAAPGAR